MNITNNMRVKFNTDDENDLIVEMLKIKEIIVKK